MKIRDNRNVSFKMVTLEENARQAVKYRLVEPLDEHLTAAAILIK